MIPKYVKTFLWSYDLKKIEPKKDKKIIISNVLNLGTIKATQWIFKQYGKEEIKNVFENSAKGTWNKKSLNFWSFFFKTNPQKIKERHVL